jgi:alcohol dehydrogenase class IV
MGINIECMYNSADVKRYYFPGRIVLGGNISCNVSDLISDDSRVGIVVDSFFAESDTYREIAKKLEGKKCVTRVLDGTPYLQDVEIFVDELDGKPDTIISIGGGSASDFAKAVILQLSYGCVGGAGMGTGGGDATSEPSRSIRYIAIPTTGGSGAEASRYCVVYDKITKGKVFGRTWNVVADWIFLDPEFLRSMPESVLVVCAFDAFVHLFETFVVRYERSGFGDMISLYWIPRIMRALNGVINGQQTGNAAYSDIICGATMAGLAISNIRTGSIHEAAGALLEMTPLSHGETLYVFFREALEFYRNEIVDRSEELVGHLHVFPEFVDLKTLDDVVSWWEKMFETVGLHKKIKDIVAGMTLPYGEVSDHIFNRVFSDKVWVTKESPRLMAKDDVDRFIMNSLARFGYIRH